MFRSQSQLLEDALAIWTAGVKAVNGYRLIVQRLHLVDHRLVVPDSDLEIDLRPFKRITVMGAGKAGRAMAYGVEQVLSPIAQQYQLTGQVNIPQSHSSQIDANDFHATLDLRSEFDELRSYERSPLRWLQLNEVRPVGQNVATPLAVQKTAEMMQQIGRLQADDLCIVLISGGGSALLARPSAGVSLQDKNSTAQFLASVGVGIEAINIVRSALSDVKAGGLLHASKAGLTLSLIVSDVLGDPLESIASGPTVDMGATAKEDLKNAACEILVRVDPLRIHIPELIHQYLDSKPAAKNLGPQRLVETPPHYNVVIGNNAVAVDAAGIEAEKRGYSHAMHIQKPGNESEEFLAEDVGIHFAGILEEMGSQPGPDCLITGGEPTVRMGNPTQASRGGRNQQLVMAADRTFQASATKSLSPGDWCLISGGSDGEDGTTPMAGVCLRPATLSTAKTLGVNVSHYLDVNDGLGYFGQVGGLLLTGPTDTNVCDLRVGVVSRIQPQPGRK